LQIRIKIAEKEYVLHAEPAEEPLLRAAAKRLNEQLKATQKQLGVLDRQDLLAMAAFDGMVKQLQQEQLAQRHLAKLDELSAQVDLALKADS
jgi:cell division protein ZapA